MRKSQHINIHNPDMQEISIENQFTNDHKKINKHYFFKCNFQDSFKDTHGSVESIFELRK